MSANTDHKQMAVVTGASSGIGLGITGALLAHGHRGVANSPTISKSKDLKASADLVLVDGDNGKKETAVKVVQAGVKHFGRIDLLVNNAGIYLPKPFGSEGTIRFSARTSVHSMNEIFPLERANEACERIASGKARFRFFLTMGGSKAQPSGEGLVFRHVRRLGGYTSFQRAYRRAVDERHVSLRTSERSLRTHGKRQSAVSSGADDEVKSQSQGHL